MVWPKENLAANETSQVNDQKLWNALATFPAEIWLIILEYIETSKTRLSLWTASDELKEMLSPGSPLWMFELILPLVSKYLSARDYYNLRLVCQKWSSVVDDFLENHPTMRPYNEIDLDEPVRPVVLPPELVYIFNSVHDITRFMNRVEFPSRHPFIGRSVSFISSPQVYFEIHYLNQTIRFLNLYGPGIWYLALRNFTCRFSLSPVEFYKGFRECLESLPNLRSLDLEVVNMVELDDASHEKFKKFVERHPLPELPYFESLEITVNGMPSEFYDMFFTMYHKQIRKLNVKLTPWREIYGNGLENLTELQLRHVRSVSMLKDFLDQIKSPNLQKLSLYIGFPLGVTNLFQILARFEQLRVLKVTSDRGGSVEAKLTEVVTLTPVHLKHLHTMELQDSPKLTYEFVVGLPELRTLVIWKNRASRGEETVTRPSSSVKLREYLHSSEANSVYGSNIWKVATKLMLVKVKSVRSDGKPANKSFYRETYDLLVDEGKI